jgi:hypothetical protein
MKTQELDFEDILRRALHTAAESVEPAADGLDRIRGRVSARYASPFMLLSQFLRDCFRPILLLLESGGAGALSGLAILRARVIRRKVHGRSGQAIGQRPRAAHRSQPPPPGLLTRLAPAASWLKPVLAVGGAVGIVVAGVFTLGQVQQAITPTNQISRPSPTHHRSTTPSGPAVAVPAPESANASAVPASSPAARPAASCSPSPKPKASTSPKASGTPTPTLSGTPTPTLSGTPTLVPTTPTYSHRYPDTGEVEEAAQAVPLAPCSSAHATAHATAHASASASAIVS